MADKTILQELKRQLAEALESFNAKERAKVNFFSQFEEKKVKKRLQKARKYISPLEVFISIEPQNE